jgi:hypothetical protein
MVAKEKTEKAPKKYRKPKLTHLGKLADITQSGAGSKQEPFPGQGSPFRRP